MYFDADPALGHAVDGGTVVVGAAAPATSWSFAEGTVRPGFVEYLTLQNPGDVPALATMVFQASDDGNVPVALPDKAVAVPARSRVTVRLNDFILGPLNVSVKVLSDQPLVVERPMYFDADPALGHGVDGATVVVGAAALSTSESSAEDTFPLAFLDSLPL